MRKMITSFFALTVLFVGTLLGGTFTQPTGIVVTDAQGKVYDIDALLSAGKHVMVHQTFSG